MMDYISRGARIFPDIGGRITMFLITIGVITSVLNQVQNLIESNSLLFWFIAFNSFILITILGLFSQTVILLILKSHFSGKFLPIQDAISSAWQLLPRIVHAWIVPMIFTFLGFLACVIPGVYLIYRYYFITHEIVFCDAKAEDAKQRSETDTEGWKVRLLAISFLISFLPTIVSSGLYFYFIGLPTADGAMQAGNSLQGSALEIFVTLFYAPFQALLYIVVALIFYENSVTMQANNEVTPEQTQN